MVGWLDLCVCYDSSFCQELHRIQNTPPPSLMVEHISLAALVVLSIGYPLFGLPLFMKILGILPMTKVKSLEYSKIVHKAEVLKQIAADVFTMSMFALLVCQDI